MRDFPLSLCGRGMRGGLSSSTQMRVRGSLHERGSPLTHACAELSAEFCIPLPQGERGNSAPRTNEESSPSNARIHLPLAGRSKARSDFGWGLSTQSPHPPHSLRSASTSPQGGGGTLTFDLLRQWGGGTLIIHRGEVWGGVDVDGAVDQAVAHGA